MKVALLQLNYHVGDFLGNAEKIRSAVEAATLQGAELCVTSELSLWGYPPKDLLLNNGFIEKSWETLQELADQLKDQAPVLVGIAEKNPSDEGKRLFNSVALLKDGTVQQMFRKSLLPTYDVFDEDRYFQPSDKSDFFELKGHKIGVTICEDLWNDKDLQLMERYPENPAEQLAAEGIDLLLNLSGSPFTLGKQKIRREIFKKIAARYSLPVVYVNQVGGNDDLVFDGRSIVTNRSGDTILEAAAFEEDIQVIDLKETHASVAPRIQREEEEIWRALVLGTKDYLKKTGFSKAILGLSGGIDSAITAAVAAEALGNENVKCVLMPSPYSSQGSIDDSLALGKNIDVETITIPIKPLMNAFESSLADEFSGKDADTTEENIQSRIRGNLLMAMSNKHRSLLLTTGNKSELSVGYCTIYGDMAGALAVIADVPKVMVYKVCRWLNETRGETIPNAIIDKVPSAELRPDQTDQDSLPPYDVLDAILEKYIEQHKTAAEIIQEGFDESIVKKIIHLVKISEFKRKQAAPGLKITDRAFGTGWRVPIASKNPENL